MTNRRQLQRRRLWLSIHRWIGLLVGFFFAVSGLSGSVLVFQHALDEFLHPELLHADETGTTGPLQEIVDAANGTIHDPQLRASFMDVPRGSSGVWTVWYRREKSDPPRFTQVYVNPRTSRVTGQREWGTDPVSWMHHLHVELLSGKTGETLVGCFGLALLISVSTGLCLWWPLMTHSWRAAWAIRGGERFVYDLHKTIGAASALCLLVIGGSGVYLVFPQWIQPCVQVFSKTDKLPSTSLKSVPIAGAKPLDLDRVNAIAQSVFPEGQVMRLQFPTQPTGEYIVRVRQPGEVRRSSGTSRVWIDQYRGNVLKVDDWNQRSFGETVLAWQFPLHNGEAFGLPGRWLVFFSGLAPSLLMATGCLLWWRKKSSNRRPVRKPDVGEGVVVTPSAVQPG